VTPTLNQALQALARASARGQASRSAAAAAGSRAPAASITMPGRVRLPAGFHLPAANRGSGSKLAWRPGWHGTGEQRIVSTPIGAYRNRVSIPLVGGQASTIVSSPVGVIAARQVVQFSAALGGSLPLPTVAGNAVIVCLDAFNSTTSDIPSISGMTLGGAAGNFTSAANAVTGFVSSLYCLAAIWVDYNCAGGQTAVAISGSNLIAADCTTTLYEVPGLAVTNPTDKTSTGVATVAGTAYSSGATAPTTSPNEFWVGTAQVNGALAAPSGSWQNLINAGDYAVAGYQLAAAEAAATYAGTFGSSGSWAAAVATFKGAAAVPVPGGAAMLTVGPQGYGNVWYPAQLTVSTTTGLFDTSVCSIWLGPAGVPVTLLGQVYSGNGVLAAALPNLSPGQYIIAQWAGGNPGDTASINIIGSMDMAVT
jgi:hypothetical protein